MNGSDSPKTLHHFSGGPFFVLGLFALVGAGLLILTWDLRPFPIAARVDDFRYVISGKFLKTAVSEWITQGELGPWLGPYDPTTLFKRPGISLILAALSALNLPFIQTTLILYLLGLAILAAGLLRVGYPRIAVAALFLVTALIPTLYDANAVRVIREVATGALELAIFGLAIRLFSLEARSLGRFLSSGTFFGLLALVALHWSIREEAVLLLFPLLLLVNGALWLQGSGGLSHKLAAAVLASVLLLAPSQLVYFAFSGLNRASYGISLVNDVSEGTFPAAVSALKGVEESPCDHTLISAVEVRKVADVSPSFKVVAEHQFQAVHLRPDLIYTDGFGGLRVRALEDPDIRSSAVSTQEFFRSIADEVSSACKEGRLKCASRVSGGIVPILCAEHWRIVPANFWGYTREIATLSNAGFDPLWSGTSGGEKFTPEEIAIFEEMVSQPLAGRKGEEVEFSQPASLSVLQRQDRLRRLAGETVSKVMPFLLATGVLLAMLRHTFLRGVFRPAQSIILIAMAGHVILRAGAFSYLSAVDGYLNSRYISVCYPVVAAFSVLALSEVRHFFGNRFVSRSSTNHTASSNLLKWSIGTACLLVVIGFIQIGRMQGIAHTPSLAPNDLNGSLISEPGKEFIDLDGRQIPIIPERLGFLFGEAGWISGDFAAFEGWARDVSANRAVRRVLLFSDGRLVSNAVPTVALQSLESGFSPGTHAGFVVRAPRPAVVGRSVRLFALTEDNRAGELNYPDSYPYRTRPHNGQ